MTIEDPVMKSCYNCRHLKPRIAKCWCTCKFEILYKQIIEDDGVADNCSYYDPDHIGDSCDCDQVYTIEPHGTAYALYHGRCSHRHGLNLATITDVEIKTLELIEDALNYTGEESE